MPDLDDIKAVYGEALSADGIDLSVAHNNREYHLTGDYRPVFARATDVVADVIRYEYVTLCGAVPARFFSFAFKFWWVECCELPAVRWPPSRSLPFHFPSYCLQ